MIFRLHGQVSKCTLLSNRRLRMQRLEGNEWVAVVDVSRSVKHRPHSVTLYVSVS